MANTYHRSIELTAAADKAALELQGSAAMRASLFDFVIGTAATPAEAANSYEVVRFTVAGVTPSLAAAEEPFDPLSPAAVAIAAGGTWATDPTPGNDVFGPFGLHQKATYRWVAQPGREIITAAAAGDGVYLGVKTANATVAITYTMVWFE